MKKYVLFDSETDEEMDIEYLSESVKNVAPNKVLVLANIGMWDGKRLGYKILDDLSDVFYTECDNATWYYDRYNLRCDASHHDGNNHYLYRLIKPDVDVEPLLEHILNVGIPDSKKIGQYTTSCVPFVSC